MQSAALEITCLGANPLQWQMFMVIIESSSWTSYGASILSDGSNCGSLTPPASPWVDYDSARATGLSVLASANFDAPPIAWPSPPNFSPSNCSPGQDATPGTILAYSADWSGPAAGHTYWSLAGYSWKDVNSTSGTQLPYFYDSTGGVLYNNCGGPTASQTVFANCLGPPGIFGPCPSQPGGCTFPSWNSFAACKFRFLSTRNYCLETFIGVPRPVQTFTCSFQNGIQINQPAGDPSMGHSIQPNNVSAAAWINYAPIPGSFDFTDQPDCPNCATNTGTGQSATTGDSLGDTTGS